MSEPTSRVLYLDELPLADVLVSPDGDLCFTRRRPGLAEVLYWKRSEASKPMSWLAEPIPIHRLFGFDGSRVFASTGRDLVLLGERRIRSLHSSQSGIISAAASPDGHNFAWVEEGEPAILWQSQIESRRARAIEVQGSCVHCCFSFAGQLIVVSLNEGRVGEDPEGNRDILGSSVWLYDTDDQPQLVSSFPQAAVLEVVPHPSRAVLALSVSSARREGLGEGPEHPIGHFRSQAGATTFDGIWSAGLRADAEPARIAQEPARVGALRWLGEDEVVFAGASSRYPVSKLAVAGRSTSCAISVSEFIDQFALDPVARELVYRQVGRDRSQIRALSIDGIRNE